MNNEDFFLFELGVIGLSDIEAYNPTDFQRQYLIMLDDGRNNHYYRLRERLFCFAGDNGMIPRKADGTALSDVELPYTLEHIQFIITVRECHEAALRMKERCNDPLIQIMYPALELVQNMKDKDEAYYLEDLKRRWAIAGEACNWDGVKTGGRMIAQTQSPIWQKLGANDLFDDGLGFEEPPFYLNGGWLFGWERVKKAEWEK